VSPLWMNISLSIFNDVEAAKEWGWVQEMYAFTIACYNAGVPRVDLHRKMMSQPPWDSGAMCLLMRILVLPEADLCTGSDSSVLIARSHGPVLHLALHVRHGLHEGRRVYAWQVWRVAL